MDALKQKSIRHHFKTAATANVLAVINDKADKIVMLNTRNLSKAWKNNAAIICFVSFLFTALKQFLLILKNHAYIIKITLT